MVKIPVGWLLGTQASTEWLTQACLPPTAFWSSSNLSAPFMVSTTHSLQLAERLKRLLSLNLALPSSVEVPLFSFALCVCVSLSLSTISSFQARSNSSSKQ